MTHYSEAEAWALENAREQKRRAQCIKPRSRLSLAVTALLDALLPWRNAK